MEERLIELETRLAFQEDSIQKLQETVTAQERQLLKLTEELRVLREEMGDSGASPFMSAKDEPPPPHY